MFLKSIFLYLWGDKMEKLEQKDLMFNDIYFMMRKFLLECDLTDTSIEYQKKIVDDCLKIKYG